MWPQSTSSSYTIFDMYHFEAGAVYVHSQVSWPSGLFEPQVKRGKIMEMKTPEQ